jgi:hypothetical protein
MCKQPASKSDLVFGFVLFALMAWSGNRVFCETNELGWRASRALPAAPQGVSAIVVKEIESSNSAVELIYRVPPIGLKANVKDRTQRLVLGNAPHKGGIGKPILPTIPAKMIIPAGHEVDQVVVTPGVKSTVAGRYVIEHGQKPLPIVPIDHPLFVINPEPSPQDP